MGGLFKKPEMTPPARMPDANDEAIRAAEARKRAEIMARSGRQSTILAPRDNGGTGGSQAYKNTVLGQS